MHLRLIAVALALLFAVGCEEPTTGRDVEIWRFAIEETQGSVQDTYAQKFKELVEERTNGEVKVVVYPYGALGTSDNILEQLHNGTLEFSMASPGYIGKLIPAVQVFLLHFVLSDDADVNEKALEDPALRALLEELYADKGLQFLSVYSEGWMVWTTNQPIRQPEDFEGLKFRVMTTPLLIAAYEAYGASPTPLPYAEVYSGLQLNMIDGQVNPVFAIEEMSFYEVTEYLTFANHAPFITTLASNPEFYQGLSPERRQMVDEVVRELHDYIFEVQSRFNLERLETMRENKPSLNIVELTEEQRQRFREAAQPVRDRYIELAPDHGQEVLETLQAAVDRAEAPAPRD